MKHNISFKEVQRHVERIARKEVQRQMNNTNLSCIDRECKFNAINYINVSLREFDCIFLKVIHGVDNNGHWCDMFEQKTTESKGEVQKASIPSDAVEGVK